MFFQIAHLKQQHTLGVTFEGIQIGRSGKLCWILVRTKMGTLSAAVDMGIAFLSVWLCVCLCLSGCVSASVCMPEPACVATWLPSLLMVDFGKMGTLSTAGGMESAFLSGWLCLSLHVSLPA